MAASDGGQVAAIAAEWGVDPELLEDADWTLQTIDGNDGEEYGYYVKFDRTTDRAMLDQLGVAEGSFQRELSLNAFDQPDAVDEDETDEDPDVKLTPDARTALMEEMVEWFLERFEDPAERTPYESAEGGYQWIWGGPYDANEELQHEFGSRVPLSVIEEAVAEIEIDGLLEWAPVASEDDYRDDDEPVEDREERLRADVQRNLQILDEAVDQFRNLAMRSHNQPPELVDDLPIDIEVVEEVVQASAEVRNELAVPSSAVENVEKQLSVFQRVAGMIAGARKDVIVGLGVNALYEVLANLDPVIHQLWTALTDVVHAVSQWLAYINPPF
jgi:hypothetical protein